MTKHTNVCRECEEIIIFSLLDRSYVEEYGICWECDKKRWSNGKITTKNFEKREAKALEIAVTSMK